MIEIPPNIDLIQTTVGQDDILIASAEALLEAAGSNISMQKELHRQDQKFVGLVKEYQTRETWFDIQQRRGTRGSIQKPRLV